MQDIYIQSFKKKLLEEKELLLKQLHEFDSQLDLSQQDSVSELSSYDNHPSDLGTEVFERSKDFALREDVKIKLAKIEDALKRIEQGSYGQCVTCGREISLSRLDAVPSAEQCDICKDVESEHKLKTPHSTNRAVSVWGGEKATQEREGVRRPVEEDVLVPPFEKFYNDDSDKNMYDGEDAWQDVARFSEHAEGTGAGAYYGPDELASESRGCTEEVEKFPYFKGANGVVYRDYKKLISDEHDNE